MTTHPLRHQAIVVLSLVALMSTAAAAQPSAADECDYARCALNVVPAWNGLAVVRGEAEERVALLGFFRAGSLDAAFRGDNDALRLAARAVRTRRVAALFTDGGLILLAAGGVLAVRERSVDAPAGLLLSAGLVSLGVSVPLQFAADGHLARAAWRYNRRFARP